MTGQDAQEGERLVTVTGMELSNAGQVITEPMEMRLAWFLAQYGGWTPQETTRTDSDGRIVGLDYRLAPEADEEAAAA